MTRESREVDSEVEGRIDLISLVWRVGIDVGCAILLESDK